LVTAPDNLSIVHPAAFPHPLASELSGSRVSVLGAFVVLGVPWVQTSWLGPTSREQESSPPSPLALGFGEGEDQGDGGGDDEDGQQLADEGAEGSARCHT
jgi:hypothetical protein